MATSYVTPLPSGVDADEMDAYFAALKAGADKAYTDHMANYVRADWQVYLPDYLAVNAPALPAGTAAVRNGDTVAITGQAINGTLVVAGNAVTGQTIPATAHVVKNGDSVVVHNAADANQAGSPGTATVAGGALTKVNLTV